MMMLENSISGVVHSLLTSPLAAQPAPDKLGLIQPELAVQFFLRNVVCARPQQVGTLHSVELLCKTAVMVVKLIAKITGEKERFRLGAGECLIWCEIMRMINRRR